MLVGVFNGKKTLASLTKEGWPKRQTRKELEEEFELLTSQPNTRCIRPQNHGVLLNGDAKFTYLLVCTD